MSDALDADAIEELLPPTERTRWGPFSPAISHAEMLSRLRVLRAFCQCYIGPHHPIHDVLWLAESGEWEDLELARLEFDRLPALRQRDVLAAYARHWRPKQPRRRTEAASSPRIGPEARPIGSRAAAGGAT
jgi:hypothetical protein